MRKFLNKLASRKGEGYVDTLVKIIICVVIGALLMAGIYGIAQAGLTTTSNKASSLFGYTA